MVNKIGFKKSTFSVVLLYIVHVTQMGVYNII